MIAADGRSASFAREASAGPLSVTGSSVPWLKLSISSIPSGSDSRASIGVSALASTPEDFFATAAEGCSEATRTVTGSSALLSGLGSDRSSRTEAPFEVACTGEGVEMRDPGRLFEVLVGEVADALAREGGALEGTGVADRTAAVSVDAVVASVFDVIASGVADSGL